MVLWERGFSRTRGMVSLPEKARSWTAVSGEA